MKLITLGWFSVFFSTGSILAEKCGCKSLSTCYMDMLEVLQEQEEANCIEDAAVGSSTVTVFLKALQEFCGDKISVMTNDTSYDSRNLYEVVVQDIKRSERREGEAPVIIIDAGQEAGVETVRFALYIIQQLVACQENKDMIENVKWVFMPNTNPDGLEFSRFRKSNWRKNLKIAEDAVSFGVDISRNFDENWSSCKKVDSGFAPDYPGAFPASEKETIFIKKVLNNHKANAKIYLSLRRNGHHIGYPYAFSDKEAPKTPYLEMVAAEIANKVNVRSGGVNTFKNGSIYGLEGNARCGHSVDYAVATGINLAFEMRMFLESDNRITSMFQTMPRGYETTLRNGYFIGIRELYSVLTNKKKYGHIWQ